MATRLIIDGNAVYEIDEECEECQKRRNANKCPKRCREWNDGGNKKIMNQKGKTPS